MRSMYRLSARAVETLDQGKYADAGLWLRKRDDGGAQWVLRCTVHGRRRESSRWRDDKLLDEYLSTSNSAAASYRRHACSSRYDRPTRLTRVGFRIRLEGCRSFTS